VANFWHEIDRDQVDWTAVFDQYLIDLARGWLVSPLVVQTVVELDDESVEALRRSYNEGAIRVREELVGVVGQADAADVAAAVLGDAGLVFQTVAQRLSGYREAMSSGRWIQGDLRPPNQDSSIEVPAGGVDLRIEGSADAAISYMLF
jgi:hypothetical protein